MGYIFLALIIGPLLFAILRSLLRPEEQEEQPAPRPRPAPQAGPPRRPPSDIDRFLEEINRRRREGVERPRPMAPESGPSARPAVAPRPRAPVVRADPVPRRPGPPAAPPVRTPRGAATRQPGPVMEVVVVDEPTKPPRSAPASILGGPLDVPAAAPVTQAAPAAKVAARPANLAAEGLVALLRSSEGLRAAMLIQQILGPPRCRRPFRTGTWS